MSDYLKTLFADHDFASLFGDLAFTILPRITSGDPIGKKELEIALGQLQSLLWRLEDTILECEPSEDFLIRFLNERFN
jgi:hypothetical protein